jgi:hypothetical protein
MYIFKIHGKEYKVRFTYRMICDGDLLDRVQAATDFTDLNAKGIISQLAKTTAKYYSGIWPATAEFRGNKISGSHYPFNSRIHVN